MVEETPAKTALARGFLVLTLVFRTLAFVAYEEVFEWGRRRFLSP